MTHPKAVYNVHIYREMRLFFPRVRAGSLEDAARIASDKPTGEADAIEDCEGETTAALIDIEGDKDYAQSHLVDFRRQRRDELLDALRSLETALDHHAHWRPTMPTHLATVVRNAITIAQTL